MRHTPWDDSVQEEIDAAAEKERLQVERVALAIENAKRYTPITVDDFRYMAQATGTTMYHQWECRMREAQAAIEAY